ncbi:MAG: MBL fold metallo-hydrolase [Christensenellaceae bacterium]|jgi:L-ascorbate metabolism protein UlaG (beta-lactamase superfamily)|nr:MBL fold metallo-hydrolase [Christensenellaceae bacterium]
MKDNYFVNYHASICIKGSKGTFYFDPFKIEGEPHDADVVFITHGHYDHLSIEDILKVASEKTIFAAPQDCIEQVRKSGLGEGNRIITFDNYSFNDNLFYIDDNAAKFKVFHSYNTNKKFHPKTNNWVGYLVVIDGVTYCVCGDTDVTDELQQIKCDVLFVPIGGTFTMNALEAAELTNKIKPKIAVPIHYNGIVGGKNDEKAFIANLDKAIEVKTFL